MTGLETREPSHLHLTGIKTWQELTEEKQPSAPPLMSLSKYHLMT